VTERLEPGADALANLGHPRLESDDVEHLEVSGAESSRRHDVTTSTSRR
jgi:hypothetical protein